MKKYHLLLIVICLLLALAGCCSHEWQEASCEAPRTCLNCGKTEGDVIAHD